MTYHVSQFGPINMLAIHISRGSQAFSRSWIEVEHNSELFRLIHRLRKLDSKQRHTLEENILMNLSSLPYQQREAVRLRAGLVNGLSPQTYVEIGRLYNVGPEIARKRVIVGMRKLRHPKRTSVIEGLLER